MAKRLPTPTVVDFETHKIESRPHFPPYPCGVSIKYFGKPARYYAFGHLEGNDCNWAEARTALVEAYANPDGVLFHHGKFDLDVAETHMGIPPPPWDKIHDTMFLLFLDDPNRRNVGLKESAADPALLDLPPDERDAVADWLVANQPVPGVRISRSKSGQAKAPYVFYLPYCPGDIVGAYANGDVERTELLFKLLYPRVMKRGMGAAYDRERKLLFCLLDMERQGIPVDLGRLRADVAKYREVSGRIDDYLRKKLKAPEINLDSADQLMGTLVERGYADEDELPRTPTGKLSSTEDAFRLIKDPGLGAVLIYRAKLGTVLGTFLENWLAVAKRSGGKIYTNWNQTKGQGLGARTGRLSSNPNFQNISKYFKALFRHLESAAEFEERKKSEAKLGRKAKPLPVCPIPDLPPLPLARSYIVPWAEGEVLIDRDFNQHELRILAHFEGGPMLEAYLADNWLDFHENARQGVIKLIRKDYERTLVKNINFGIIYGEGVGSLAAKNDSTVQETRQLKNAILSLYPGLRDMYDDMRLRAKEGRPLRTWGGREYYCEPPTLINGKLQTWDYKMVNTLIQGSAADCAKEAIVRYYAAKPAGHRLFLSVHDQLTGSAPKSEAAEAMWLLQGAMESVEFDLPILSEGKWSAENWAALKDYDKKDKIVEAF